MSGVVEFLNDLKKEIEKLKIEDVLAVEANSNIKENENGKKSKPKKNVVYTSPKLNFVTTTYYKGTALEKVLKELEEYLDTADRKESDINNI